MDVALEFIYTLFMLLLDYEEPRRKLAVGEYFKPATIRLKEGRLFWQPVTDWERVKPTVETFVQFLQLGNASDREILKYAQRWGVLNLCKQHRKPVSHNLYCDPFEAEPLMPLVPPGSVVVVRSDHESEGEPVSEWRRWARIAMAIVNISRQLDDGNRGDMKDWQALIDSGGFSWGSPPRGKFAMTIEKGTLARFVNQWLELGNVRPHAEWKIDFTLDLAGGGLFGALAVQLLENGGEYVIVACTGCRKFFDATPNRQLKNGRKRRPKTGQGRYCQECLEAGVPVIMAKRRKVLGLSKPRKFAKRRKDRRK